MSDGISWLYRSYVYVLYKSVYHWEKVWSHIVTNFIFNPYYYCELRLATLKEEGETSSSYLYCSLRMHHVYFQYALYSIYSFPKDCICLACVFWGGLLSCSNLDETQQQRRTARESTYFTNVGHICTCTSTSRTPWVSCCWGCFSCSMLLSNHSWNWTVELVYTVVVVALCYPCHECALLLVGPI